MVAIDGRFHFCWVVAAIVASVCSVVSAQSNLLADVNVFEISTEAVGRWLQDNSTDNATTTTSDATDDATTTTGDASRGDDENQTTFQKVTITGSIKLTVTNLEQFTSEKGKTMLAAAIADVAGVLKEYVQVTVQMVSRRLAEESLRRLTSGKISVDYTITLPSGDTATTNSQATLIVGKIKNTQSAAFKTAMVKAAQATGMTDFDVGAVTGVDIQTPIMAKTEESIDDVAWVNLLLGLSCENDKCTVNQLVTKCNEANRDSNVALCEEMFEVIQGGVDEFGDAFDSHIASMCNSKATNKSDCNAVFDYYADKEKKTTTVTTSKPPGGYDDEATFAGIRLAMALVLPITSLSSST